MWTFVKKRIHKFCIDCGKQLSTLLATRCKNCANVHKGKDRSVYDKVRVAQIGAKNHAWKGGFPKCVDCGVVLRGYQQKRCRACATRLNNKLRGGMEGKNNPNYIDGRYVEIRYCIDCGKALARPTRPDVKRCGSCFAKSRVRDRNPNWKGGKSAEPYGIEFNVVLKAEIRERDAYECQNCGMTEEEHLVVVGTNLQVHHIDYDKKNNIKTNLITLCTWCNTRANSNRAYWKEFFIKKIMAIVGKTKVANAK